MPRISQVAQLRDCEALLRAVGSSEAELPGVAPFRAALEIAYSQAVSARVRREALLAAALDLTVHVRRSLVASAEAARSLRLFIKSVLGSRNQKLTRYGIQPLRKRSRFVIRSPIGYELPS
jgi:hypothetical protein